MTLDQHQLLADLEAYWRDGEVERVLNSLQEPQAKDLTSVIEKHRLDHESPRQEGALARLGCYLCFLEIGSLWGFLPNPLPQTTQAFALRALGTERFRELLDGKRPLVLLSLLERRLRGGESLALRGGPRLEAGESALASLMLLAATLHADASIHALASSLRGRSSRQEGPAPHLRAALSDPHSTLELLGSPTGLALEGLVGLAHFADELNDLVESPQLHPLLRGAIWHFFARTLWAFGDVHHGLDELIQAPSKWQARRAADVDEGTRVLRSIRRVLWGAAPDALAAEALRLGSTLEEMRKLARGGVGEMALAPSQTKRRAIRRAESEEGGETEVPVSVPMLLAALANPADSSRMQNALPHARVLAQYDVDVERVFRYALEVSGELFGETEPNTMAAAVNLGQILLELGKEEEAVNLFDRSVEGLTRRLRDDGESVVDSLMRIAASFDGLGRTDRADELYRALVDTGGVSVDAAGSFAESNRVARAIVGGGNLARATEWIAASLERFSTHEPHAFSARLLLGYCQIAGSNREGERTIRAAVEYERERQTSENDLLVNVTRFAQQVGAANQPRLAYALLDWTERVDRLALSARRELATAMDMLGSAYYADGRFGDTKRELGSLLEWGLPLSPEERNRILHNLAIAEVKVGEVKAGEARLLALVRTSADADPLAHERALASLVEHLREQRRHGEALEFCRELLRLTPADHPDRARRERLLSALEDPAEG